MAKLGWLGLPSPEEQGGAGLGLVELASCWRSSAAPRTRAVLRSVVLGGLGLVLGGSAAQKEKWLSGIAAGNGARERRIARGSARLGSRATKTTATRAGDGCALSGVKRFVPWAHVADVVLVPARSPEGLSLFLVDPKQAGVALKPMVGIDLANRWSEMRLDNVRVGADAVVGQPGAAGPVLESLLRRAAVCASAEMLGAARRCLDMSVGYVKVREQFGQLIGSFQAIRHRCAEMLLDDGKRALRRLLCGVGARGGRRGRRGRRVRSASRS